MIEHMKMFVNEHRILIAVIIGVLLVFFLYWYFCCKDKPPVNTVNGGRRGIWFYKGGVANTYNIDGNFGIKFKDERSNLVKAFIPSDYALPTENIILNDVDESKIDEYEILKKMQRFAYKNNKKVNKTCLENMYDEQKIIQNDSFGAELHYSPVFKIHGDDNSKNKILFDYLDFNIRNWYKKDEDNFINNTYVFICINDGIHKKKTTEADKIKYSAGKHNRRKYDVADIIPAAKVKMMIIYICFYFMYNKSELFNIRQMIAVYALYTQLFNSYCSCFMSASWNESISNEYVYIKNNINGGEILNQIEIDGQQIDEMFGSMFDDLNFSIDKYNRTMEILEDASFICTERKLKLLNNSLKSVEHDLSFMGDKINNITDEIIINCELDEEKISEIKENLRNMNNAEYVRYLKNFIKEWGERGDNPIFSKINDIEKSMSEFDKIKEIRSLIMSKMDELYAVRINGLSSFKYEVNGGNLNIVCFKNLDDYGLKKEIEICDVYEIEGEEYETKSIGDGCFNGCTSLLKISIPPTVESLGASCFSGCSSLIDIIIHAHIKSIGDNCFNGCSSLTNLFICYDIESLGAGTFSGCSSLKQISIPNTVKSVGAGCFSGCSSLQLIRIYGKVEFYGDDCFSGCSSLTSIIIPDGVKSLGAGCFSGCSSLEQIFIFPTAESLGANCFSGCTSLRYISIPGSVKSLGAGCFSGCSSLEYISIPDALNPIVDDCFSGCPGNLKIAKV